MIREPSEKLAHYPVEVDDSGVGEQRAIDDHQFVPHDAVSHQVRQPTSYTSAADVLMVTVSVMFAMSPPCSASCH